MLGVDAEAGLGDLRLRVRLEVEPGECLALAGPSGAGKTSVLRVVAGLLRPERGLVRCGEETWLDTARRVELPPERRRCGYLFQEYALFPHLSALANVAYPLRGLPRRERRERALALLRRFGLEARAGARPATLSGGERQRVALARALARRPRALLLDEPLSALDARTRSGAGRELGALLREVDAPALLVTHDFAEAAQLGDRVAVIDAGKVIQEGAPSELAATPQSAFVADFAGAVVLPGTVAGARDGLTLVALDGGGTVASTDPGEGRVAATVFPWEIGIGPLRSRREGSLQNRLGAEVTAVTTVGGRVRLGLAAPQPLAAEISRVAAAELRIAVGDRVTASWKATATRLVRA